MAHCPLIPGSELTADEREAKFLPGVAAVQALWAVASRHLRPQSSPPFTYVRTTYFDTPERAYYRSDGYQVRVREYAATTRGDEAPTVAAGCFLELKRSSDGRRTKTRLARRPELVAGELAELVDGGLAPLVATWYRRRALVDGARQVRITLDDRFLLCRPRPLGSAFTAPTGDEVVAEGPSFVLEYKTWGAPPAWLADALRGAREAVGFSKFVLGVDALERAPLTATVSGSARSARLAPPARPARFERERPPGV